MSDLKITIHPVDFSGVAAGLKRASDDFDAVARAMRLRGKMRYMLLILAALCVVTIGVDFYLGLTLDTPFRWVLIALTPLPAFAAGYAVKIWVDTA